MDSIVRVAWDNLDQPEIARGLAQAVLSRMRLHDSLMSGVSDNGFDAKIQQDTERRRKLLATLLPLLPIDGLGRMAVLGVPLLTASDFDWLIQRILSGDFPSSAQLEAKLVGYVFDWRSRESFDRLYAACQSNEILKSECGNIFGPVALDSPEVQLIRKNSTLEKAWKERKVLHPPPSERIERDLGHIEAGNIADWMALVFDLSLEPTSSGYGALGADLTSFPGWQAANSSTKDRILEAAFRFVSEADPNTETWINTNSTPVAAIVGFHALALLLVAAETS